MTQKAIFKHFDTPHGHWVGDGFPVKTFMSYHDRPQDISPFLLLDYAGPAEFPPSNKPRGVGQHPHRGFETVTIVYQGEVAHGDNAGNSGVIGPGDVQWMTAGYGIVHEEMHSNRFTQHGGIMEMVQLWVNLPAAHKSVTPAYQTLLSADIPVIPLPNNAGTLRVIAGQYMEKHGPARSFTPINMFDMRLNTHSQADIHIPDGHHGFIFLLRGEITINGATDITGPALIQLTDHGDMVGLQSKTESVVLVLSGEPINEPVTGHGPFVMNTQDEIRQAFIDYRDGVF